MKTKFKFHYHKIIDLKSMECILSDSMLSLCEIEHLSQYQGNIKTLTASYYGILLIKQLLSLENVCTNIFYINSKPMHDKYYISISHSNEYVIGCISLNPIGIDLEKMRSIDHEKIVNRVFNQDKVKQYRCHTNKDEYFFETWCEYEAHFKMNYGQKNHNYQFHTIGINQNYKCKVCIALD